MSTRLVYTGSEMQTRCCRCCGTDRVAAADTDTVDDASQCNVARCRGHLLLSSVDPGTTTELVS